MSDRTRQWRQGGRARAAILCTLATIAAPATGPVAAGPYPDRPIRMIVPAPPGSPSDAMARILSERLAGLLGQPITIENHSGAGGTVGAKIAARSGPDGHTLLFGAPGPLAIGPVMHADVGYDPLRSFAPVAFVAIRPQVLVVHPGVPGRSVYDLVAYAKANPFDIRYASLGYGTQSHLLGELLRSTAGVLLNHVPHSGSTAAIAELLNGNVQMYFDGPAGLAPHIAAGRLRALAIASETRTRLLPQVPTMIESGFGRFIGNYWTAVVVPAGTPDKVIGRLNLAINTSLQTSDVQARLAKLGAEAKPGTPRSAADFIAAEVAKWSMVARAAGMQSLPRPDGVPASKFR